MPQLSGNDVTVKISTEADTDGVDKAEKRILGFNETAVDASKKVAIGFLGLGAATGALGLGAVKMAADMEQSQIAFTTLLKSSDQAKTFLKQLFDFAAKTPFEFTQLQDASRKLLAFGFDAKQIIPMMTNIGDAASSLGIGAEGVNRVTLALGQMKAKGKVSAQEMMQLAEAGIPAWEFLAKKIGTDIPTAMKQAEKGAVDADTGIGAVLEGMNSRFAGGMEAQSKTVLGTWSTLKDTTSMVMVQIGDSIIKAFNLSGPNGNIAALTTKIQEFGTYMTGTVIPFLQQNQGLFVALGLTIATLVAPAFIAWAVAAGAAAIALIAATWPVLALIAVGTALYLAWNNNFFGIRDITLAVWSYIKNNIWGPMLTYFEIIKGAVNLLHGAWDAVMGGIKQKTFDMANSVISTIKGMVNGFIDTINGMIRGVNGISSKIHVPAIPEIPHFASGTQNFRGGMALVGENGPEIVNLPRGSDVIPNNQIGGAGVTIHQTNNIYSDIDLEKSIRDIAFAVATA